jgi:hypothetical protein
MPDYTKYKWKTKMGEVRHGGKVAGVVLDTTLLDEIIGTFDEQASQIIEDIGFETTEIVSHNAPVDTSALARSYLEESDMVEKLLFKIQDGVPYGIFNELGTSRMAARPHVVPAVEGAYPKLVKAFAELLK